MDENDDIEILPEYQIPDNHVESCITQEAHRDQGQRRSVFMQSYYQDFTCGVVNKRLCHHVSSRLPVLACKRMDGHIGAGQRAVENLELSPHLHSSEHHCKGIQ